MARNVIWAGFALRLLVAVWNGFFGPSLGAESDALHFHQVAVDFARTLTPNPFEISWVYAYALGVVYRLTVESVFLGSVLSCVAWLIAAEVLLKTMRVLSFQKAQRVKAMLVFALLPSSILWTSVTLREPYQLLMVNLAIYAALKIHLQKSAGHWLWLFVAAALGSVLHGALLGFGVFLIVATSIWILLRQRRWRLLATLIVVAPFVVVVLGYGLSLFRDMYSGYGVEGGLSTAVEFYQRAGLTTEARTAYKDTVTINGAIGLLTFVPVSLFQYLFEPMPLRIALPVDALLALENVIRGLLIWRCFIGLRKKRGRERRALLLVFCSYLVLETIWSVGTINWGTAARHHISSGGLLALAAFTYAKRRRRRRTRVSDAAPSGMMGEPLPVAS